ncbi:MAG: FkbM family methyltransferase [Pseudomonadota bacterium]
MRDIVDIIQEQTRLPGPIQITDVGAMQIGGYECWHKLIDRGLAILLGFEPQEEECRRRNAESKPGCRYLPEALGDGETWPFHHCDYAATSSIYEPNHDFIRQFNGLSDLMQVVEKSEIRTRRLDDVPEARQTDFLKLDIQGAELLLLENAKETLNNVSLVQTEVSYVPLYKDQPLFADVDQFLRAQGFMLHTILEFGKRTLRPLVINDSPYAYLNQILWSDVVYVKPFWDLPKPASPSTLLKAAILLDVLFNSCDFAARAFAEYDRFARTSLADAYVANLGERAAAA